MLIDLNRCRLTERVSSRLQHENINKPSSRSNVSMSSKLVNQCRPPTAGIYNVTNSHSPAATVNQRQLRVHRPRSAYDDHRKLGSKRAYHAIHYPRIHGLAASAGVLRRTNEMGFSAALRGTTFIQHTTSRLNSKSNTSTDDQWQVTWIQMQATVCGEYWRHAVVSSKLKTHTVYGIFVFFLHDSQLQPHSVPTHAKCSSWRLTELSLANIKATRPWSFDRPFVNLGTGVGNPISVEHVHFNSRVPSSPSSSASWWHPHLLRGGSTSRHPVLWADTSRHCVPWSVALRSHRVEMRQDPICAC